MKQILVFDFDGVICNSIHDSLMTAVNSYIQFVPEHRLPLDGPLKAGAIFAFEKAHPEFFGRFSRLMPMGNFAQDYYVFLSIIENDTSGKVTDQAGFDAFKRAIPEETRSSYQELFYEYRQSMQDSDPEGWASRLPPFPGIPESIHSLSERYLCAIATSKDYQSVDLILSHYGLRDYFQTENILDKDFAASKRDHLIRFHQEHDIPFEAIHFIDDKVLHLVEVKDLGVHAYLSTWGFNTEREHEMARKEGIALLKLDDLPLLGR